MVLTKSKFHGKLAMKLVLLGAGASLLLTPLGFQPPRIEALQINPDSVECQEGFSAETQRYYVSICYNRNGSFYVGRAKNGSGSIVLPVSSVKRGIYVARNGRYTYTLNENTRQLIITLPNGRRSIERVIRIIDS